MAIKALTTLFMDTFSLAQFITKKLNVIYIKEKRHQNKNIKTKKHTLTLFTGLSKQAVLRLHTQLSFNRRYIFYRSRLIRQSILEGSSTLNKSTITSLKVSVQDDTRVSD